MATTFSLPQTIQLNSERCFLLIPLFSNELMQNEWSWVTIQQISQSERYLIWICFSRSVPTPSQPGQTRGQVTILFANKVTILMFQCCSHICILNFLKRYQFVVITDKVLETMSRSNLYSHTMNYLAYKTIDDNCLALLKKYVRIGSLRWIPQ